MPEMLGPTGAMVGAGLATSCCLLTDGRFSGASRGFIVVRLFLPLHSPRQLTSHAGSHHSRSVRRRSDRPRRRRRHDHRRFRFAQHRGRRFGRGAGAEEAEVGAAGEEAHAGSVVPLCEGTSSLLEEEGGADGLGVRRTSREPSMERILTRRGTWKPGNWNMDFVERARCVDEDRGRIRRLHVLLPLLPVSFLSTACSPVQRLFDRQKPFSITTTSTTTLRKASDQRSRVFSSTSARSPNPSTACSQGARELSSAVLRLLCPVERALL